MNRMELVKALEIVKPGLAIKEHIEQSTCFAFLNGNIVTYNDEISVSHPIEGLSITGAIKAEEFYQVLNKLKKDEIEIAVNGSEVLITSGKAKAGLTLQEDIKMPLDAIGEHGKWKKAPDGLIEAIKFVSFACSSDASRPILTCVNVETSGTIMASDSFRIIKYELGEKIALTQTFLIPATTVKRLNDCKPTHIAEGQGWIHFKTAAGTVYSCRTFFGDTFPDTSKVMSVEGEDFELPKAIEEVLDRASIFSKEEVGISSHVTITIMPKKMLLRGQSNIGWFEEAINLRYDGPERKFSIRPELLKDVCRMLKKCIIGEKALKFIGDNWEYVGVLEMKE